MFSFSQVFKAIVYNNVLVHSGKTKRLHAQYMVGQESNAPARLGHPPSDSSEESPQIERSLPNFQGLVGMDFFLEEHILDALRKIQKEEHTGAYFMEPVDKKEVTDYADIVTNPMVCVRCGCLCSNTLSQKTDSVGYSRNER